jgi:hypothetical protein
MVDPATMRCACRKFGALWTAADGLWSEAIDGTNHCAIFYDITAASAATSEP